MEDSKEYAGVHSAQFQSDLAGPALLDAWDEFEDGITHSIQTVFPTLVMQLTLNSLAVRFFVPRGVDKTELYWVFLGYETEIAEGSGGRGEDSPRARQGIRPTPGVVEEGAGQLGSALRPDGAGEPGLHLPRSRWLGHHADDAWLVHGGPVHWRLSSPANVTAAVHERGVLTPAS